MSDDVELTDTTTVFRATTQGTENTSRLHLDGECRYLDRAKSVKESQLAAFPPAHQNWCPLCGADETVPVRGGDA